MNDHDHWNYQDFCRVFIAINDDYPLGGGDIGFGGVNGSVSLHPNG